MNAVKWYRVFDKDIDYNGNINPNARLLPYYAELYNWHSGMPEETVSSADKYDNTTNVHNNRHFNIYEKNKDPANLIKRNSYIRNRGYSAAGYARGREKYNDMFDSWTHNDPNVSEEELYNMPGNEGDDEYELNSVVHTSPEELKRSLLKKYPKKADREAEIRERFLENMADMGQDVEVPYSYKGNRTVALPFIVSGDDDDIVTLGDVLENNYDPGRDFLEEVQLKNIRAKRLPSGLIAPVEYYAIDDEGKDQLFRFKNDIKEKLHQYTHSATANKYSLKGINDMLQDIAYPVRKIVEIIYKAGEDIDDDVMEMATLLNTRAPAYSIVEQFDLKGDDNYKANSVLSYIENNLSSLTSALNNVRRTNPIIPVSRNDWKEFFNKEFNINDAQNISDAHCKHIIKDASNYLKYIGKRKLNSNVLSAIGGD